MKVENWRIQDQKNKIGRNREGRQKKDKKFFNKGTKEKIKKKERLEEKRGSVRAKNVERERTTAIFRGGTCCKNFEKKRVHDNIEQLLLHNNGGATARK